jgi:hypothetical protein
MENKQTYGGLNELKAIEAVRAANLSGISRFKI